MKITFTTSDFNRRLCNKYENGLSDDDIIFIINTILLEKINGTVFIFENSASSKLSMFRLSYKDDNTIECSVDKNLVYKNEDFNIRKDNENDFNKFKKLLNLLA